MEVAPVGTGVEVLRLPWTSTVTLTLLTCSAARLRTQSTVIELSTPFRLLFDGSRAAVDCGPSAFHGSWTACVAGTRSVSKVLS